MTEVLPYGTLVEITENSPENWGDDYKASDVRWEVQEYYRLADLPEDEQEYYDGNFYEVISDWGGFKYVREDHIKTVMTVAEANARTLPTPHEIAEYVGGSALSGWGTFEFSESDPTAKDGTVILSGRTDDGLYFQTTLRVISVLQTDY